MKAIILAAGRGSRLGSMTKDKPKPLTELAGKPLLEWQISSLKTAGVNHITLIGGYQSHHLLSYGDNMIENPNWQTSNMVRSLLCGDEILSQAPTIVSYGDIAYQSKIVSTLMNCHHEFAISYDVAWHALWAERFEDPLSDAETFIQQQGLVTEIGKKTDQLDNIQGQYMGLMFITPPAWQRIKRHLLSLSESELNQLDMTTLISNLIAVGFQVGAVAIEGGWVEVDTPTDAALYEAKAKQSSWHHNWQD